MDLCIWFYDLHKNLDIVSYWHLGEEIIWTLDRNQSHFKRTLYNSEYLASIPCYKALSVGSFNLVSFTPIFFSF